MTAEEKTKIAAALDLAEDYLRDGYIHEREKRVFVDDPPESASPPASRDTLTSHDAGDSREALAADIRNCTACPLHRTREKAVPGDGAGGPLVLILGDAPGEADEESGKPFAGTAGELLDRMLKPIALSRFTNCFLTNRVKCRPAGGDRIPAGEERAACAPFLKRELALLKPLAVLSLENNAGESGERRAGFPENTGIPFFSTCHPGTIQADERLKRPAWEKLKALSAALTGLDRDYAETLRAGGKG
jgi:DNA polymerase